MFLESHITAGGIFNAVSHPKQQVAQANLSTTFGGEQRDGQSKSPTGPLQVFVYKLIVALEMETYRH